MPVSEKRYVRGDELMTRWRDDFFSGTTPRRFDMGDGMGQFRLGPGTVALLGGAPGMGKTALVMQCVISALMSDESLKACVANVEMPPERLLERQMSRMSGVLLDDIQNRTFSEEQRSELDSAFETLLELADRLVFVRAPMTLGNVALAADSIDAELIVLDYIQRIRTDDNHDDRRGAIDATMDSIRQFADAGCCVIALSAVGRSRDSRGRSSYGGANLSLASFRESSELEYGADDAYLIVATDESEVDTDDPVVDVTLRHLKSRYGQPIDIEMEFDRSVQRFDVVNNSTAVGFEDLESMWGEP